MNNQNEYLEDEDFYPHRHDFSALNQIKVSQPTDEEIKEKKKTLEILKEIDKYEMLFPQMRELMYQSALEGENLDEAYEMLKHWMAFM